MNNIKINESINQYANNSSVVPPTTHLITVKLDSGATNHYFKEKDKLILKIIENVTNKQKISLPNGTKLHITQKGDLLLPSTNITQTVNILPHLKTVSLLSVGKLVDDGCVAQITKNCALICRNKKLLLKGKQNMEDGLYDVQFTNKTKESNINEMKKEIQNQKN